MTNFSRWCAETAVTTLSIYGKYKSVSSSLSLIYCLRSKNLHGSHFRANPERRSNLHMENYMGKRQPSNSLQSPVQTGKYICFILLSFPRWEERYLIIPSSSYRGINLHKPQFPHITLSNLDFCLAKP